MENNKVLIRIATIDDAKELLDIYAVYVEQTAISFECEVPSLEEFKRRIQKTLKKYPYIIAEYNGEILGYAYLSPFVGRAAYDWAAETTIYIKENKKKMGIGRKLYDTLENISKAQNILNLNACIGCPLTEDKYLTKNSMQFHEHLGYRMVGEFYKCGYKFGIWYNMVWMEKIIGNHVPSPLPIIPFPDLADDLLHNLGISLPTNQNKK